MPVTTIPRRIWRQKIILKKIKKKENPLPMQSIPLMESRCVNWKMPGARPCRRLLNAFDTPHQYFPQ